MSENIYILRGVRKGVEIFRIPKEEPYMTESAAKEYVAINQFEMRLDGIELELMVDGCEFFEPVDVVWDLEQFN